MDEIVIACVVMGVVGLILIAPILALVALFRTGRNSALQRRIRVLEDEVARLQTRSFTAEGSAPAAQRATAPTPADPAPQPEGAPDAAFEPAPDPAFGPAFEPIPDSPGEEVPAYVPAPEPVLGEEPEPPTPRPSPLAGLAKVDWERWVGVRGAAVLGGMFFALASILFVKVAFEEGWIDPLARCWMGAGFGLVCIVVGTLLRRRRFRFAPNALEGAGIVALYASVWAAHQLYGYLSLTAAFPLLGAITVLACVLAVRHRSQLTAVLGLVGGFTAAWMLSSQQDRPLGLFGYVLLLDLGLLLVGRKGRWPLLGLLALFATFFFEGLWIFGRMDEEGVFLGLAILATFALVFVLGGRFAPEGERRSWLPAQASAVVFPFAFALYFAGRTDFGGGHLYPTACLVGILAAAGCWLGRAQRAPWLPVGAAAAAVAVSGVWLANTELDGPYLWQFIGVTLGLVAVFHGFAEAEERSLRTGEPARGRRLGATVAAIGSLGLVVISCTEWTGEPLWPWLLGLGALAAVLGRLSTFQGLARVGLLGPVGLGLGLAVWELERLRRTVEPVPSPLVLLAVLAAIGAAYLAFALLRERSHGRDTVARVAYHGVPLVLAFATFGFVDSDDYFQQDETTFLVGTLALAVLILFAATRLASRLWFLAGAGLVTILHGAYALDWDVTQQSEAELLRALCVVLGSVGLVAAWPLVFRRALEERRHVWAVVGLAILAAQPATYSLYVARFSDKLLILPFGILGSIALGAGIAASRLLPRDVPDARRSARSTALAWTWLAASLLFGTALPAQITQLREIFDGVDASNFRGLPVALCLFALGTSTGFRALRPAGGWLGHVAWFCIAAGGFSVLTLPESPRYEHEPARLLNWISLTHVLCFAALLGTTRALSAGELPGLGKLPGPLRSLGVLSAGFAAIAVGFVWLNLLVLNHFAELGQHLSYAGERMQARDLATSIGWALYALILLGLGMGRRQIALRWSSLLLLLLTVAKVFLYDLGELDGLHRVGSLTGLAISLLVVSLLYQRFVFRLPAPAPSVEG